MDCRICKNSVGNKIFSVKEMMLGTREKFTYFLCNQCGCLQIENPLDDLTPFYPKNYYSFRSSTRKMSLFKRHFTKYRDIYAIETKSVFLGGLFNLLKPAHSFMNILGHTHINRQSKILDVGSGSGTRLLPLVNAGYDIVGMDPYIDADIHNGSLTILKKDIFQIEGQWDLIMLNHVFEHIVNPEPFLKKIHELLSNNGTCLIRIPVIPSYAWEKYGVNWYQIDAPRHVFIHSLKSMQMVMKETGFSIEKVIYDSIPSQFMASELFAKDIASHEGDFRLKNNKYFSDEHIQSFLQLTKELNEKGRGDQAAFLLKKG